MRKSLRKLKKFELFRLGIDLTNEYYHKIFRRKVFTFNGRTFQYFYHRSNRTWETERAVEIPIVWEMVKNNSNKNILEVGNVLSHYFPVNHDIVDKYETSKGVINKDIVDFKPSKKYDLIITISTIEHVGYDEEGCAGSPYEMKKNPQKTLLALENLNRMLNVGGKIIVTIPLGYNPYLDNMIKTNKIVFTKMFCFRRISENGDWIETNWNGVKNSKYNYPFLAANGLIIGVIEGNQKAGFLFDDN